MDEQSIAILRRLTEAAHVVLVGDGGWEAHFTEETIRELDAAWGAAHEWLEGQKS